MAPAPVAAIVPTWNRAATIGRALASIFAQTRPPEEVWVVDDGSTDGTAERVAEAFPAARVLRWERRRGVSAARNRGIAAASAPWLAFLDSDDEWRPRKLERQLAALAARPGTRVCHADEIWIRRGRRVNPRRRHAKRGGWIFDDCLEMCHISPSAAIVHRSVLDEVGGFDERLPACEDYDLWLRVTSRMPVLLVDEPLVVKHGGRADQLSHRVPALDRYRVAALEKILRQPHLDPRQRAAAGRTLARKAAIYAAGARKRGRVWEAERVLARARAAAEAGR